MKILFASPHLHPWTSQGQLAEFARFLPASLAQKGHEVFIFTPRHASVDPIDIKKKRARLNLNIKGKPVQGAIHESVTPEGISVFLVEQQGTSSQTSKRPDHSESRDDADEKAVFFCRSVLEACRTLEWAPDVIHCNDWQCGPIPALLQFEYRDRPELNATGTLLTIHDLGQLGTFPPESMLSLGLGWNLFTPSSFESYGKVSYLKGGLVFSDKLTTTSKNFAEEIKKSTQGSDLSKLFSERSSELRGIPLGIDTKRWDPRHDRWTASGFSAENLQGKSACRQELLNLSGLEAMENTVLLAVVDSPTSLQELEIFLENSHEIMNLPCQWIFPDQADAQILEALAKLKLLHPEKVATTSIESDQIFHKVIAGADMLFVPCQTEPCGTHHLCALRYGTIPLVYAVASLDDTIDDIGEPEGNGFKISPSKTKDFLYTLRRAVECFTDQNRWRHIMSYAMSQDHSWELPARRYEIIYRDIKALRAS